MMPLKERHEVNQPIKILDLEVASHELEQAIAPYLDPAPLGIYKHDIPHALSSDKEHILLESPSKGVPLTSLGEIERIHGPLQVGRGVLKEVGRRIGGKIHFPSGFGKGYASIPILPTTPQFYGVAPFPGVVGMDLLARGVLESIRRMAGSCQPLPEEIPSYLIPGGGHIQTLNQDGDDPVRIRVVKMIDEVQRSVDRFLDEIYGLTRVGRNREFYVVVNRNYLYIYMGEDNRVIQWERHQAEMLRQRQLYPLGEDPPSHRQLLDFWMSLVHARP